MASFRPGEGHIFGGRYQTPEGKWDVALRPCGESYEVVELSASRADTVAIADDANNYSALFTAPRSGADRYPDWAEFEWSARLGNIDSQATRVWRIAESLNWATFLGQAVEPGSEDFLLPLPAALWRGWSKHKSTVPRALFWPSEKFGHLWLTDPSSLPRYVRLGSAVSADALVFAMSRFVEPRHLTLDIGAATPEFREELTGMFPGKILCLKPFSEFVISPSIRDQIGALKNPSMFLPALGAARVRAEGAPPVLSICESSPEATADGA